jgi:hypothetical protein
MNNFIYKNKSSLLKLKRAFNAALGIEIVKYPTHELDRRIKLLQYHAIDVIFDIGANIGQYGGEMRSCKKMPKTTRIGKFSIIHWVNAMEKQQLMWPKIQ